MSRFRKVKIILICTILLSSCSFPESTEQAGLTTQTTLEIEQTPPSITATSIGAMPTESPVMIGCEDGTILLTSKLRGEGSSLGARVYVVCADGTSLRELLSNSQFNFGSLDISPDGQTLALSGTNVNSTTLVSTLSILNLNTLVMSELVTREQGQFGPQWSANGEYLAYLLHTPVPSDSPPETYIEVMHVATGTTSEIHLPGLSHFDWSPDSDKAVFGAWIAQDEHSLEEHTVYIGDMTCSDITHTCQLTGVNEILNVGQTPSWVPGSQTLVSISTKFSESGNRQTLVLTDIHGNVVQDIDTELLDSSASTPSWPRASSDGRYLGFISSDHDLYILDLDQMSLQNITANADLDLEVVSFDWLQ